MPADYLSRNLVNAISWDSSTLQQAQNADPLLKALKSFLLNKELPHDAKCQSLIKLFANDCFIEDDIIWRRIKRQFEPSRVVIFLPASLVPEALSDAHGNLLVGHDGIYKTKERLLQCFFSCHCPTFLEGPSSFASGLLRQLLWELVVSSGTLSFLG